MKVKRALSGVLEAREAMIERALGLVLDGVNPLDLPYDLRIALRVRAKQEAENWQQLSLVLGDDDGSGVEDV